MTDKIRLENVTYIYGKGTPFEVKALDGVDLEIHAGLITGIIGHTGSGKSTLVRLFNGLEKPESGKVLLDGADIWEKPADGRFRYRLSSYTCLAGDITGDYEFDSEVNAGDRLVFEDMAIYSMVKNNTFNGIPLPDIAIMDANGDCRVWKHFDYDEFKRRL